MCLWECGFGFYGNHIEDVKTFTYLGYTFKSNGSPQEQVTRLAAEANKKLGEVWSIGERKFTNKFGLRMMMFDALVKSGMLYGCEIYGWTAHEELERVHRRFLKWTLGLKTATRNAIVMVETDRTPISMESAKRAMAFERKSLCSPNAILRECVSRMQAGGSSKWRRERERYFERVGWGRDVETAMRVRDPNGYWRLAIQKDFDVFMQLVSSSLEKSPYKNLRPVGLPIYLREGFHIRTMARFRCGTEERGRDTWRDNKMCRICGTEVETIGHLMGTCCPADWDEVRMLSAGGGGIDWMRYVLYARE